MEETRIQPWQWGLYDFANSLANAAVAFYFSLWFIEDLGGSNFLISIAVTCVTFLLIGTLPQLGTHIDRTGAHVRYLTFLTLGSIVALCALTAVSIALPHSGAVFALICYAGFQYFYQASVMVYTSLLRFISKGHDDHVRVSGIGFAMGQFGNILGLLLALPIANEFGRSAAFIGGGILFLLFAAPALYRLQFVKTTKSHATTTPSLAATWRTLRSRPMVWRYLLGYYLFADAVLTMQLFLTVYLSAVADLTDDVMTYLLAGGLIITASGGLAAKWIAQRWSTKRAIDTTIVVWSVLLAIFAFVNTKGLFMSVALMNAFTFGLLFTLSQAYYATLAPKNEQANHFGLYSIFERASSFLGPLVWSTVVWIFHDWGDWSYRFAMLSLAFLVFGSFLVIRKVK